MLSPLFDIPVLGLVFQLLDFLLQVGSESEVAPIVGGPGAAGL